MALTNASVTAAAGAPEPDILKPATEVAASGAMIEPEIVSRIDTKHPAVDDNPRAGQSKVANAIDFNDPTISGQEAVRQKLGLPAASADAPADDKKS